MKVDVIGDVLPEWMHKRIKKLTVNASLFKETIEIEFYPETMSEYFDKSSLEPSKETMEALLAFPAGSKRGEP